MTTWRIPGILGLAGAAGVAFVLAAACISERSGSTAPQGSVSGDCSIAIDSGVVGQTQALVAIRDFAFVPATVRIKRGTTVTWINCERPNTDSHTSTSDAGLWTSELLGVGDRFSRQFDDPGTFPYHCTPHPFMTATVIVED